MKYSNINNSAKYIGGSIHRLGRMIQRGTRGTGSLRSDIAQYVLYGKAVKTRYVNSEPGEF